MFRYPTMAPQYGEPTPILGPFNFTGMPDEASPHGKLDIPGCDVVACGKDGVFKIFAKKMNEPKSTPAPPKYGEKKEECRPVDLLTVVAEGKPVYEYV